MDKILNLNNVDLYNQIYGLETLHPLVTVIDLNKATRQMTYTHWNYGVYALYLKLEKACDIKYGRQTYDYQEGTVVCFAPGQTTETTLTTDRVQLNVVGILFHPDLLHPRRSTEERHRHRYEYRNGMAIRRTGNHIGTRGYPSYIRAIYCNGG